MEQREGNLCITVRDERKVSIALLLLREFLVAGFRPNMVWYSIQERMRALAARSAPGEGTTALLSLPLIKNAEAVGEILSSRNRGVQARHMALMNPMAMQRD